MSFLLEGSKKLMMNTFDMKELFKVCTCHLNNPCLLEAFCEHRAFLALSRFYVYFLRIDFVAVEARHCEHNQKNRYTKNNIDCYLLI